MWYERPELNVNPQRPKPSRNTNPIVGVTVTPKRPKTGEEPVEKRCK
jgi:hypothetical protein